MREILFRGFHKDENGKETIYLNEEEIKGKWIEGYYFKDFIGDSYIINESNYKKIISETVGQYTGLDDKNGKKIFEGDVVKYDSEETDYIVMFDATGYWCLDGNGARNSEMLYYEDIFECLKVISTIFDKEKENENN